MAETVLVRRRALGDVILLGSVTGAIEGHVTVVTEPRWMEIARRLEGVDRVVAWPQIPSGRVVDLEGSVRTRLRIPRAARIHKRGLSRRLRVWFGIGARRPTVPEIYAEAVGVTPRPAPWIALPRDPDGTLVLSPGAAWAAKRWSPDRYRALAARWTGPVAIIGGPGEEALATSIAAPVGARVIVETGFTETLAVLARAAVVVSGDSGLMHLAGACAVPVVGLFGPTEPADGFWVYPGDPVERSLPCRPCTLHRQPRCPLGHHDCMDLSVEAVEAAIRAVL